jgi:hypothetical protein
MSLRQFLYLHNIAITLTDCWHVPLCCEHDQYLMEPALSDRSFTKLLLCPISPMEMAELSTRSSWLVNDQSTAAVSSSLASTSNSDEFPR